MYCAARPFVLVLMLAALLVWGTASPAQAQSGRVLHVTGTFFFDVFAFTSATTAFADGYAIGDLASTTHADYFNIEQRGKGVTQLNGMHTLYFSDGSTLSTFDESLLQFDQPDTLIGRANSRLYIIGGTGRFAGAGGVLHTHGEFNVVTLEGGIDYRGRIYLP